MSCRKNSNQKIFSFKENKSILTLVNVNQAKSECVHVDGCEINDTGIRCDFLHLAKGIEMYIELKGQDLVHAMNQIHRTMSILSSDVKKQPKISYIICTRSPLTSTEIQGYSRKFKELYNSKLVIKSSPHTDNY